MPSGYETIVFSNASLSDALGNSVTANLNFSTAGGLYPSGTAAIQTGSNTVNYSGIFSYTTIDDPSSPGNSIATYTSDSANNPNGDTFHVEVHSVDPDHVYDVGASSSGDSYNASGPTPATIAYHGLCLRSGTRIATAHGQALVEHLAVGDLVVTSTGKYRPIRWLGHRTLECRNHADPRSVWPVRITAHAFGESRPARDLYVSPGHAICVSVVDDVLIPASALVNGATVTQVEAEEVIYWHVELDSHDVLLAENLPAESYRDVGNRGFFVECPVVDLAATPDGPRNVHTASDLTFTDRGPILDAVRIGLRARALKAGWTFDKEPFAGLHVVADGVVVHPNREGLTARFVLPASAEDVWLVSETSVPFDVGDNPDRRRLGVSLLSLTIDDGLATPRRIALNDPRLSAGLHAVERLASGERRWTDGRARLPASLWEGSRGAFFLRVELTGPALPRWVAPDHGPSTGLERNKAA